MDNLYFERTNKLILKCKKGLEKIINVEQLGDDDYEIYAYIKSDFKDFEEFKNLLINLSSDFTKLYKNNTVFKEEFYDYINENKEFFKYYNDEFILNKRKKNIENYRHVINHLLINKWDISEKQSENLSFADFSRHFDTGWHIINLKIQGENFPITFNLDGTFNDDLFHKTYCKHINYGEICQRYYKIKNSWNNIFEIYLPDKTLHFKQINILYYNGNFQIWIAEGNEYFYIFFHGTS